MISWFVQNRPNYDLYLDILHSLTKNMLLLGSSFPTRSIFINGYKDYREEMNIVFSFRWECGQGLNKLIRTCPEMERCGLGINANKLFP
jgi:hypothetical protein